MLFIDQSYGDHGTWLVDLWLGYIEMSEVLRFAFKTLVYKIPAKL